MDNPYQSPVDDQKSRLSFWTYRWVRVGAVVFSIVTILAVLIFFTLKPYYIPNHINVDAVENTYGDLIFKIIDLHEVENSEFPRKVEIVEKLLDSNEIILGSTLHNWETEEPAILDFERHNFVRGSFAGKSQSRYTPELKRGVLSTDDGDFDVLRYSREIDYQGKEIEFVLDIDYIRFVEMIEG